jgi:MGT family glycosyltransferase
VDGELREPIAFPWDQLDGRPLVYGSLGTLQNGSEHVFQTIAEACSGLDAQLVLSLGGSKDPAELGNLPGHPVVVRYAPQLPILKRAAAVITHAGLNTTLESLAEGVPLVAIPLGNDQPGVAARIEHHQAGMVVPLRKLTVKRLRGAIDAVLRNEIYCSAAKRLQTEICKVDGLEMATDIIENSLSLREFKRSARLWFGIA